MVIKVATCNYPNINATARNLSSGHPLLQQQYKAYAELLTDN